MELLHKKFFQLSLFILLLSVFLICFFNHDFEIKKANTNPPSHPRKLTISVTNDSNMRFTVIPSEKLGGNFNSNIVYLGVTDVNIDFDGETISLEQAIREKRTTAAEIFANARMDAQNKICTEQYESIHGLSSFLYHYPEFKLYIVYDIYETPDGQQHLIEELSVYNNTASIGSHFYIDNESKFGYFLDREDWGLNFCIEEVTPYSIKLNYSQSDGQQIGDLIIENYSIFSPNNTDYVKSLDGSVGFHPLNIPVAINGTSQIFIDWSKTYGKLDKGNYQLRLDVSDIYEKSQVHPLMENYYDTQPYYVEFTIG